MIEGTTEQNFQVNCGGWNCRHQLVPVAKEAIPKEIRAKFEKQEKPAPTKAQKPTKTEEEKPILKKQYKTNEDVEETINAINSTLDSEKWFENGALKLHVTHSASSNGMTDMFGKIYLRPERLDRVKTAMSKIGQGKSKEISFEEADAMATFWHEITHNRNVQIKIKTTKEQEDVMEMMNEFVARKTLPEFYSKLGCKDVPYPEFMNNRASTGYNCRVLGYDFVISKLGLNAEKVLESAKKNLFNLNYTDQETTATQALLDGGLNTFKRLDGKPIGKAQMKKIVILCRNGFSTQKIENYLKKEGIIK